MKVRNIYIKMLVLCLMLLSCKSDIDKESSTNSTLENKKDSLPESAETSIALKSQTILTKAQFNDFFPIEIDGYKLIDVSVEKFSATGSASYIKDNDYNHSMTYSLQDGDRKGSAELKNFEAAYMLRPQGPAGTEYMYTERDGYKTIAFLQPKIKRNDIRFIYNNRFRLTLEGTADVETLWSYFKKEDLQKLDTY